MKHLSKKFMLSIVAIALVVIALGTSTFAWFTLSNKASVGQFNAEVTAGEGMELSVDQGSTWYSTIPSKVIQKEIEKLFVAAGGLTNGTVDPLDPTVSTDPILTAVTTIDLENFQRLDLIDANDFVSAAANKHFIKINIMVRAVELKSVYVSGVTLTGTDTPWTSDVEFRNAKNEPVIVGGTVNVNAANAARVGIKSSEFQFIYEKDAISNTNTVLGSTIVTDRGQADYFSKKTGKDLNSFDSYPNAVADSVIVIPTVGQDPEIGIKVLSLTEVPNDYNTGNFDLFVWFEGFDADTFDAILKMKLNIQVSLEGKK